MCGLHPPASLGVPGGCGGDRCPQSPPLGSTAVPQSILSGKSPLCGGQSPSTGSPIARGTPALRERPSHLTGHPPTALLRAQTCGLDLHSRGPGEHQPGPCLAEGSAGAHGAAPAPERSGAPCSRRGEGAREGAVPRVGPTRRAEGGGRGGDLSGSRCTAARPPAGARVRAASQGARGSTRPTPRPPPPGRCRAAPSAAFKDRGAPGPPSAAPPHGAPRPLMHMQVRG